ncbi:MAG: hypothetical protein IKP47_10305 [Ruminococcus sp.]|nr:hypothetical protein [Ruminococcus sp.]
MAKKRAKQLAYALRERLERMAAYVQSKKEHKLRTLDMRRQARNEMIAAHKTKSEIVNELLDELHSPPVRFKGLVDPFWQLFRINDAVIRTSKAFSGIIAERERKDADSRLAPIFFLVDNNYLFPAC